MVTRKRLTNLVGFEFVMTLLLVVFLCFDVEAGLFQDRSVALDVELRRHNLLVLDALFVAIKDVLHVLS